MAITVYCDGLCEPKNPGGIATYGFAIYRDEARIHSGGGVVGEGAGMSNNVAEYAALHEALLYLKREDLTGEKVVVKADSRLLIQQMKGAWKARKGLYLSKYKEVRGLQADFMNIGFQWVPREENREADALSRRAYRQQRRGRKG